MEEEQSPVGKGEQQLIKLIKTTYLSKSTEQISIASKTLEQYLKNDEFIIKIFSLLTSTRYDNAFHTACAILLKKFSYEYSMQKSDKSAFLRSLFELMNLQTLSNTSKETLGVAMEYILNHDEEGTYGKQLSMQVLNNLSNDPQIHRLNGYSIICTAYLNSLVQVIYQIDFYRQFCPIFLKVFSTVMKMLEQAHRTHQHSLVKEIISAIKSMISLIELALSRIIDEEEVVPEQAEQIRADTGLNQFLYSLLMMFNHKQSIISRQVESMNEIKQVAMQIIYQLYRLHRLPINIFNIILLTVLLQSQCSQEEEQQHILCRCMQILESQITYKHFYDIFDSHQMALVLVLLKYSVTTKTELDLLHNEPEKFVEIAEEYAEGFQGSPLIKIRAACLLKVFAAHIDGALKAIVEILSILFISILDPEGTSSAHMKHIIQSLKQFQFFSLEPSLKLDVALMGMALLSPLIGERPDDLLDVVKVLMMSNLINFSQMSDPLILARVIRTVSYFQLPAYYPFIVQKMKLGRVFSLEGIKAFERILKKNKKPELMMMFTQIITQIISVVQLDDSLFKLFIYNFYNDIIKNSKQLYGQVLTKIQEGFLVSYEHQKKELKALMCLGYIQGLLLKQQTNEYCQYIIKYYSPMQASLYQSTASNRQFYEQKVISINQILLNKFPYSLPKVEQFAISSLPYLHNQYKGSKIYQFYNVLLLKIDNQFDKVNAYYQAFMNQIGNIFKNMDTTAEIGPVDTLPFLAYLIGQILVSFHLIHPKPEEIQVLLNLSAKNEWEISQWLNLIVLEYLYVQPLRLKQLLNEKNAYQQTLKMLTSCKYTDKFSRKIYLLAMTKLLEVQDLFFKDIMLECMTLLKLQIQKNKPRQKKKPVHIKLKRIFRDDGASDDEEECIVDEGDNTNNNNQYINFFVKFRHPFDGMSAFDQFKIRVWQSFEEKDGLTPEQQNDLREILETDYFGAKTRRIRTIVK